MRPRAFLFDLDGTLIDSEGLWAVAIHDYLVDHGASITVKELLALVFGHSWFDIHAMLFRRFPVAVPVSPNQMAHELRPYYLNQRSDGREMIIPGSVELLKKVAGYGPTAIVSGSPRHDIEDDARIMGIQDDLTLILGAEDYDRGKPAPDGFLEAARLLKVSPAACVVFEDSPAGVASAKFAKMTCVALDRFGTNAELLRDADLIVDDLMKYDPEVGLPVKKVD